MSVQDKMERALRELYIMLSRSDPYDQAGEKVILEKRKAIALLNELRDCAGEMMEAYEATADSRERGELDAKKKRMSIIRNANQTAEDIYAASVMYTDEALNRIQNIIQETNDEMEEMFQRFRIELNSRKKLVRENQMELKSSLEDLKDTEKYMNLIEERNKQIEREERRMQSPKQREQMEAARQREQMDASRQSVQMEAFEQNSQMEALGHPGQIPQDALSWQSANDAQYGATNARKPDIKVNQAYFDKIGALAEERDIDPMPQDLPPEEKAKPELDIRVNLDAEYFRWREEQQKKEADG